MKNELKNIMLRIEKLEAIIFQQKNQPQKSKIKVGTEKSFNVLDFSLNERTFVKRHVVGKSGPKRFTLLVAFLMKGKVDSAIELNKVKALWKKMSSKKMLGNFNMFYPNEAKNQGWVDSKKYGNYELTKEWTQVL